MITAIANDCGYEYTLEHQLIDHESGIEDVVLLISSSGNSPNIVKAAKYAKKHNIPLIGFTGFNGGQLKRLADISVHVESTEYGIIEDCHSHIMHTIAHLAKY